MVWTEAKRTWLAWRVTLPPSRVAVLRVDGGKVLVRHQLDADACRALLARLRQEDHVAVQRQVGALQQQHHHQRRREVVLVVHRAAAVDVAAVAHRAERRMRPLLRVHVDDVGVAHDQQRPLAAVALDARDHVGPVGLARVDLDRQAFASPARSSGSRRRASRCRAGRWCRTGRAPGSGAAFRPRPSSSRARPVSGRQERSRMRSPSAKPELVARMLAMVAELKLFPSSACSSMGRPFDIGHAFRWLTTGRGQLFCVCSVKASKSSHSRL